mmetsp:Transcript_70148/g.123663  ORF Transcript_70148/g.123663 Transcript_70148/m.123663 type:complete len:342 (-) Transcript_70148:3554-4579(-)
MEAVASWNTVFTSQLVATSEGKAFRLDDRSVSWHVCRFISRSRTPSVWGPMARRACRFLSGCCEAAPGGGLGRTFCSPAARRFSSRRACRLMASRVRRSRSFRSSSASCSACFCASDRSGGARPKRPRSRGSSRASHSRTTSPALGTRPPLSVVTRTTASRTWSRSMARQLVRYATRLGRCTCITSQSSVSGTPRKESAVFVLSPRFQLWRLTRYMKLARRVAAVLGPQSAGPMPRKRRTMWAWSLQAWPTCVSSSRLVAAGSAATLRYFWMHWAVQLSSIGRTSACRTSCNRDCPPCSRARVGASTSTSRSAVHTLGWAPVACAMRKATELATRAATRTA